MHRVPGKPAQPAKWGFRNISGMFFGHGGRVGPIDKTLLRGIGGWRVAIATFALGIIPCVLPCLSVLSAAQTVTVGGVVKDSTGAVVVGATIHAQSGRWESSAKSDASGRFSFASALAGNGTLDVTAEGFIPVHRTWSNDGSAPVTLEIVLEVAPVTHQVIVSAARTH